MVHRAKTNEIDRTPLQSCQENFLTVERFFVLWITNPSQSALSVEEIQCNVNKDVTGILEQQYDPYLDNRD